MGLFRRGPSAEEAAAISRRLQEMNQTQVAKASAEQVRQLPPLRETEKPLTPDERELAQQLTWLHDGGIFMDVAFDGTLKKHDWVDAPPGSRLSYVPADVKPGGGRVFCGRDSRGINYTVVQSPSGVNVQQIEARLRRLCEESKIQFAGPKKQYEH